MYTGSWRRAQPPRQAAHARQIHCPASRVTQDTRPNVLFIQSDQHCAAVTGCYGDPVVQTPNLDRLAARGVVMDSAYCASPICVPSRSSLLTGRHPFENRVWTNMHMLDSAIPTMAHAMGAAGYRPVQVGRLHFNGPDQLHGFAERFVGDHGPNYAGGAPVDHGSLAGTTGPHRVSLQASGHGQSAYEVHDEHVIRSAVNLIDGMGSSKSAGEQAEPFSLSLGLMLPHQPYVARKPDYDQYRGTVPMPSRPEPFGDAIHPYLRWWREQCGIAEVTRDEVLRARTAYWALVTRMDAMIGEVLDALERSGLSDDTLVVYTSDHGDLLGEHGLWWKQTFYEESVRVPMVLSLPGVLPQGNRCNRVVSHMDLNATVLEAIGAPPLPRSRGRSFLGLLRESGTPWDDVAFSEYCTDSTSEALAGGLRSTPAGRRQKRLAAPHGAPRLLEARILPGHGAPALQPEGRPRRDARPGSGSRLPYRTQRPGLRGAGGVGPGGGCVGNGGGTERPASNEVLGAERATARHSQVGSTP